MGRRSLGSMPATSSSLIFRPVLAWEVQQPLPCFSATRARTSRVFFFTAVPGAKDFRQGALSSPREPPTQGAAGRQPGLRHQLHRRPPARPLLGLAHQSHPRGAPEAVPETDHHAELPQLIGLALQICQVSASRGSKTKRKPTEWVSVRGQASPGLGAC